jgi:hypothetical protein
MLQIGALLVFDMISFRPTVLKLLAGGSLLLCSCGGSHNNGYLTDHFDDFVDLTVPAQASGITKTNVNDERWAQHASWEFDAAESATDYTQWVRSRMTGFTLLQSSSTKLIFSKTMNGDAASVVAQITPNAKGIHVTVNVDASPD